MDEITARVLTVGGPWALVALAVVMLLRGDIVSRRVLDDALRAADKWERAHARSEDGRHEALRQNGEMLEAVHTANHVLGALPPAPGREVSRAPMDQTPSTAPQE